jgi:putative membrane protein
MELIKLTAIGFVLGITAIIPGFSVATMAVVFNVYDRLINVIVPSVRKIAAAWLFWLPLIIGGLAGVFLFSRVFTALFENFYIPAYWFFIGVITGGIPIVYARVRKPFSKWPSLPSVVCCVFAIALMVFMAIIRPEEGTAVYTEPALPLLGFLFLAGVLGATAMIIPGISGAFLLLVIGLYRTVLQAVSDLNIILILPVVLGAVFGLLISAAFVRFLLLKAPRETYGAVLGLVAGSIFVLYPGGFGEGVGIVVSVVCLFVGFVLSFIMGRQKQ